MKHKTVQKKPLLGAIKGYIFSLLPPRLKARVGLRMRSLLGLSKQADLGVNAFVSHKYRLLFIGIPKNAQTSTMRFLKGHAEQLEGEALSLSYPLGEPMLTWVREYYSFIIFRDPVARIVSCYRNKIVNLDDPSKTVIVDAYEGLSHGMTFADFLQWLLTKEGGDECANRHWVSQYKFIMNEEESILHEFSRVVRMSEVDSFIDELSGLFSLDRTSYARHNKSAGNLESGAYKLDDDLREMIYERYAKDYEMIGFDK